MANYVLTRKALDDLSEIWNYSAEVWSEFQADKYYQMLIRSCEELGSKKVVGKSYSEIRDGLFGYKIGQHIIFYRSNNRKKIEVIRILHSRMDLNSGLH